MFKRILIANRGEIAVRIVKACKELGITSIVIYSDADKHSLHVRVADEAYHIGPSAASESYLEINKIISLAKEIKADAIHPGYGFFSENAEFIDKVNSSGIKFIGPSAESVSLMGSKTAARTLMKNSGVPIVPGTTEPINSLEEAQKVVEQIGLPVMIKASAGGGGKGMRKVDNIEDLSQAIERAKNEAKKAFGNDDLYIEKFIENPKHIEVQILADEHGNYIHLFERECSVQRRHQKVVEEAPSNSINQDLRDKVTNAAIKAAKACNYYNAGTIEFLYDQHENFYFLEMNTRLQVEHPVTEMITGVDLVKEQIKIASGEKLTIQQKDLKINGHAIECRIYAEDVDNNFAPSIGKIFHHRLPSGPGIRVDRGIDVLSEVTVYYDPMLSKLVTWGNNRNEAIVRMKRALAEYQIAGVKTNINSFYWILDHDKFIDSSFDINFLANYFLPLVPDKWRDNVGSEYKDVVAILGAFLKERESSLKSSRICISKDNHWESLKYE
ncbi:MAG: acetyl-CoA carboxylase biotin carboxylase subunit [Ignavibacteriales bacterium]|nr:acetyl-CoA carboxylase biotin carboxylase subunit [Ignavibacteriales bacterium]MCB9209828.1 acetyl-CoA carboxylase biotin carboxylase subunit [Ignavibacteriales bacterium]